MLPHSVRLLALCSSCFAVGFAVWYLRPSAGSVPPPPEQFFEAALPSTSMPDAGGTPASGNAASLVDRVNVGDPLVTESLRDGELQHSAWDRLPQHNRQTLNFVRRVKYAPHHVTGSDLLRHADLNPGQVKLSDNDVNSLQDLIAAAQRQILPLVEHRDAVQLQEVRLAREAGVTTKLMSTERLPEAVLNGEGLMVSSMQQGADREVVPASALQGSRAINKQIAQHGEQLGGAIVTWFTERGLLDPAAAAALRTQLAK